jgi:PAS domain S-box-containing protein
MTSNAINNRKGILEGIMESYKDFYETAPIGFYRTCLKTGKFLMVNPACLKMLGYDSLEELQKSIKATDLYPKSVRKELIEKVAKYGQVTDFEIKMHLPSGEEKWVMVSAHFCKDSPCLEGSLTDITSNKELEKKVIALQRNELGEMNTLKKDIKARINNYISAESA